MRAAPLLAFLMALLLAVASVTAVAARDDPPGASSGGRGHAGNATEGNVTSDDGDDDGNRSGRSDDMRALTHERHDAREAAWDDLGDREDACRALNESARRACLEEVRSERRAFHMEQHDAFDDALDALKERPAVERVGAFAVANGTAAGTYVSADVGPGCALRNVMVQGVLVLDAVSIAGANGTVERKGASLHLDCGDAGSLRLHDNPAAALRAKADDDARWAWDLASGLDVNATRTAGEHTFLRLGVGNFSALLRLDGANGTGDAWTSQGGHLVAHGDNVLVPGAANRERGPIEAAKHRGHVGAEISLVHGHRGNGSIEADVELDEDVDVNVTAQGGRVRVILNATGLPGKAFVLNLATGVVHGNKLALSYYDEVNGTLHGVPIAEADLSDVLEGGRSVPVYALVEGPDGHQLVVHVPHFSTHVLEVQGFLEEVPPSVLAGLVAGAFLVAVAGAGLTRRRR